MSKVFLIPMLFLAFFMGGASSSLAQEGVVSVSVRANPLQVTIIAPANVTVGQAFEISAQVSNLGAETIRQTAATLNTPPEISVKGNKRKVLANLSPGETKTAKWQATADSAGNFVVQVEATGELLGEQISQSDSTVISASPPLGAFLARLLFGV